MTKELVDAPLEIKAFRSHGGAARTWEDLAFQSQYRPSLLAMNCGVSMRTLQRKFNQKCGMGVGEWLRRLRLHEAYQRLRDGHRAKEVAYDLGYKQLSHFSRDFKTAYGIPPSLFSLEQRQERWKTTPSSITYLCR